MTALERLNAYELIEGGEKNMSNLFVLNSAAPSLATDLLTPVKTELMTQIGAALPIAGGIFAVLAGVMVGFKFFKKITGARA